MAGVAKKAETCSQIGAEKAATGLRRDDGLYEAQPGGVEGFEAA